jgi:hypothetical protein
MSVRFCCWIDLACGLGQWGGSAAGRVTADTSTSGILFVEVI